MKIYSQGGRFHVEHEKAPKEGFATYLDMRKWIKKQEVEDLL